MFKFPLLILVLYSISVEAIEGKVQMGILTQEEEVIVTKELIPIEKVMEITEKVVDRYYFKRAIPSREKEDTQQEIIQKYLIKKDQIWSSFKNNSKKETYLVAVLNRMCCEVIRSGKKNWNTVSEEKEFESKEKSLNHADQKTIIKNELNYLDAILRIFNEERSKVELFLKFYFRLKIEKADIINYYKPDQINDDLFIVLNQNYHSDYEVYEVLTNLVNEKEKKNVQPDAVRIWTNTKIHSILKRLNNTVHKSYYDKKTLQILFEYYYQDIMN
jgi:DNA-directed RNA polymerase specialized sigma24 family protein